ncbi:MAG: YkgJ family cysteine cluster protein [Desulfobacterales bacterium]|nr:YkgJ family cysteine cluster protein [Desulfobacterales bacterium]
MKQLDGKKINDIPGKRLLKGDSFAFRCYPEISCFNRCCRNLNLFLYPYDVIRLRRNLEINSDEFLDQYVDIVLRPHSHFPDVLLRMADNKEKTCPFLSTSGCSVYLDRPDTCRTFPVEQGLLYDATTNTSEPVHFLRPPDFCQGQHESQQWTIDEWCQDQQAIRYNQMTVRWAEVKRLFENNPWGAEGPYGARGKMAFMACYNIDRFRSFVFDSSFKKRYKIKPAIRKKLRIDDDQLLQFGFEWVKFFLWGITPRYFKPK